MKIMKILFEGTEEQVNNLKALIAKQGADLPKLREDYQTENLWTIGDVTGKYDCTQAQAMEVLTEAIVSNPVMEQIWDSIDYHANDLSLKEHD